MIDAVRRFGRTARPRPPPPSPRLAAWVFPSPGGPGHAMPSAGVPWPCPTGGRVGGRPPRSGALRHNLSARRPCTHQTGLQPLHTRPAPTIAPGGCKHCRAPAGAKLPAGPLPRARCCPFSPPPSASRSALLSRHLITHATRAVRARAACQAGRAPLCAAPAPAAARGSIMQPPPDGGGALWRARPGPHCGCCFSAAPFRIRAGPCERLAPRGPPAPAWAAPSLRYQPAYTVGRPHG
jgi:hypothetical protein